MNRMTLADLANTLPEHKIRLEPRAEMPPRPDDGGGPGADGKQLGVCEGDCRWKAFGTAVLSFHHRVALTAMCRCGRTTIECDVLAQARAYGLLPG